MTKILVIDDEKGVRRLLDTYFRDKGYDVILAENGPRGLELFCQDHPHIIVLDLNMRGTDGLAVLHDIRRLKPEQRVIMFTGACEPTQEEQIRALGITEIVDKGSSLHRLEEALKRVLNAPDSASSDRGEKSKDSLDEREHFKTMVPLPAKF
jgi:two-component system, response regulator, stage 0 sporulation protein F